MSKAEDELELLLRSAGLQFEREYRFHPVRRWRFDFAAPEILLAVEVEGITRFGRNRNGSMRLGRHQTSKGIAADCEKYNAACEAGYRVLRYPHTEVTATKTLEQIERVYRGLHISR